MLGRGGRESGGGERRDHHREPEPEHQHPGQHVAQVAVARPDAGEQQDADRGEQRPGGHLQPRADP